MLSSTYNEIVSRNFPPVLVVRKSIRFTEHLKFLPKGLTSLVLWFRESVFAFGNTRLRDFSLPVAGWSPVDPTRSVTRFREFSSQGSGYFVPVTRNALEFREIMFTTLVFSNF